jgi:hypothetical protein
MWIFVMFGFLGCTSDPKGIDYVMVSDKPVKPNRILVHDFAVAASDLPVDAPVAARLSAGASPSTEQLAMARQLSAEVTTQLVASLRAMGLPVERALPDAIPHANDVVIRGSFVSVREGDTNKHLIIGIDFAASQLMTAVEGFQITPQGVARRPAIAVGETTNGNAPGVVFTTPIKIDGEGAFRTKKDGWVKQTINEIAERVRARFKEQGWLT